MAEQPPPETLSELVFRIRETSAGRQDLIVTHNVERETLSAPDLQSNLHGLILALEKMELEKGDRVAIFSENRPEWPAIDFACQILGLVTVPLHPDLDPDTVGYILRNSASQVVFYSGLRQRDLLLDLRGALTMLPQLIAFTSSSAAPDALVLTRLLGEHSVRRGEIPLERFRGRVRGDDPAARFYRMEASSPEVVEITHREALERIFVAGKTLTLSRDDLLLSHLPFSHLSQWILDLLSFLNGARLCYAATSDVETVGRIVLEEHPTVVSSHAALFELLAERIRLEIERRGGLARKGFAVALGESTMKAKLSRRFLLGPIRKSVGLERLRYGLCCGAPLTGDARTILEAVGVPITRFGA